MDRLSKGRDVAYFYDEEVVNYNYGGGNPMRPHRARLTKELIDGYGLHNKMQVQRMMPKTKEDILLFHADDYVDFLMSVTPENQEEFSMQMRRFNLGPVGEADCPVFDGMFEFFRTYVGGSVGGAGLLNDHKADVVFNWSGGMHHAKKGEASGFCYINDIVLAILELLKVHQRVLYLDIDIHHGDGVEEAFYTTDRVMTVSFHKYGDFFPGTGAVGDVGYGEGKLYSVNVPLMEGMDDDSYKYVFEPVMQKVMELYQPGAIVVCAGADSLSGDKLGCFNLSLQGHSNCIEFMAKFNVPMLVVGGGGYTMRNVARCWCYETGRMLGLDLPDELPESAYRDFDYYMDTHRLRIAVSNMKNANTREQLDEIRTTVLKNLSGLPPAPSAQMQVAPPKTELPEQDDEPEMDVRGGGQAFDDKRVVKDDDYASDEEDVKPQRHSQSHQEPAAPPPAAQQAQQQQQPASHQAPEAAVKEEPLASIPASAPPASSFSVAEAAPAVATTTPATANGGEVAPDAQYIAGMGQPAVQPQARAIDAPAAAAAAAAPPPVSLPAAPASAILLEAHPAAATTPQLAAAVASGPVEGGQPAADPMDTA